MRQDKEKHRTASLLNLAGLYHKAIRSKIPLDRSLPGVRLVIQTNARASSAWRQTKKGNTFERFDVNLKSNHVWLIVFHFDQVDSVINLIPILFFHL